jgi:pyruvate-ferredoxin/flavodoxin oxidoreductase
MLFAKNAQETGDLALIARRVAEDTHTPFLNIMDGFLTTHTIENVKLHESEMMDEFVGKPQDKLVNMMDPYHPVMSGVVQNQDSYMKGKIAQRIYTDEIEQSLLDAMKEFETLTGRTYGLISEYKMEDAEYAIVGMGSMIETAESAVDYLRSEQNIKVGIVHITSFRPFPGKQVVDALKNVKAFSILERMDNPLAESNPLTMEVKSSFADNLAPDENGQIRVPQIYSGSAGLGSRDVRPDDIMAVVENMIKNILP